jgi:hypothetical protein
MGHLRTAVVGGPQFEFDDGRCRGISPTGALMVPSNSTDEYCNADAAPLLGIEFPRRIKPEFLRVEYMFTRSLVFLIFKCNISCHFHK